MTARIVYLPVTTSWVMMLGCEVIVTAEGRSWATRKECIAALARLGLSVTKNNAIEVMS